jgi:hypothetical protein
MAGLPACERNVAVGHENAAVSELFWQADHETGTLEQWLDDGNGRTSIDGNGQVEVSSEHARSGDYALAVTISANDDRQNQGLLERDLRLVEGRYGAWYYLPEAVKTDYWVLMKLSNGSVNRFDIDIEVPSGGQPHLRLYEHDAGWISERAEPVVPIGQWLHVEAWYRSTPNDDGRLIVFQDGEQVLDTGPRMTAADEHVVFACGSSSRYVSPAPYRLFIDDASIESSPLP